MDKQPKVLPGTARLEEEDNLTDAFLRGLSELLDEELARADAARPASPLFTETDPDKRQEAVEQTRRQLYASIGLRDPRLPCDVLELCGTTRAGSLVAEFGRCEAHEIRWPVFDGVDGEGLLIRPKDSPRAFVVALPDADQTPEEFLGLDGGEEAPPIARALAASGCMVVVPVLIDRDATWSGNPAFKMTNQPHREFLYRMAYVLGRHIIGYETQKVLALVDYAEREFAGLPIGVWGYGEGGLVALHAAAADTRIGAACVSGYFRNRTRVWSEPIYRNVWRRCRGHTDAELAALVSPRPLIVEACPGPAVDGPPPARPRRAAVAAPGRLDPAPLAEIEAEAALAQRGYACVGRDEAFHLAVRRDEAVIRFLAALGLASPQGSKERSQARGDGDQPILVRRVDAKARQRRQFRQLCDFTQRLILPSATARAVFWPDAARVPLETYVKKAEEYRAYFWDEVIGRVPVSDSPLEPQSLFIEEAEAYRLYKVVLRIWPKVPNYGFLLVPSDIASSERRPAVVCQHGLGGIPEPTLDPENRYYHGYARRLAERGYVVYAPQNPYNASRGDAFRVLQRKANPLGWTLFSLIAVQHRRILDWLGSLPFVNPERIGFYGLSYGGKSAMRLPALLEGYALSICSGDFNEWVYKNASIEFPTSYMFSGEYEIFEFNLANTFNYAEMAQLICPRPFMVERGHHDGVAADEWVAYEYAKVRRHYADLGIPERTEIEFFQGRHEIRGEGSFAFLDRHLAHRPVTSSSTGQPDSSSI